MGGVARGGDGGGGATPRICGLRGGVASAQLRPWQA